MAKKILILSGSPKKNGNTDTLSGWLREGAEPSGADVETVRLASLKLKSAGCTSCRLCQRRKKYGCVIRDDASGVILKMAAADVVVFATPLYFFSASAQTKTVMDRMFSLYKWDNCAGTMETVLKGKTLAVIASAFEAAGLKELEKPFRMTADYTGMRFASLLVPDAGKSGGVLKLKGLRERVLKFGARLAV